MVAYFSLDDLVTYLEESGGTNPEKLFCCLRGDEPLVRIAEEELEDGMVDLANLEELLAETRGKLGEKFLEKPLRCFVGIAITLVEMQIAGEEEREEGFIYTVENQCAPDVLADNAAYCTYFSKLYTEKTH